MQRVYATKRFTFEAAHHLERYEGKCSKIHGHSYKMEVTMSRESFYLVPEVNKSYTAQDCMVLDFSVIKRVVNDVIGKFDHCNLNDYFVEPTAECMVVNIFESVEDRLIAYTRNHPSLRGVHLEEIKLWETEDSYVTYRGERT